MNNVDPTHIVEHTDTFPLPKIRKVDELIKEIGKVLSIPQVKRAFIGLHVDTKEITVQWRGLKDETADVFNEEDTSSIFEHLDLVEIVTEEDTQANQAIGEAVLNLERQGMLATHCLIGPETLLFEWICVNIKKRFIPEFVMGTRITVVDSLAEDVIVIAGGNKVSSINDLTHGYKINIPVKEN
jgi:hypothetical protein